MSYLRYQHILLIGISVQKCENVEEEKNIMEQLLFVTSYNRKPC